MHGETEFNGTSTALALLTAATLAGCWQPPRADVHPSGPPGMIEQGIAVESLRAGVVQSFDSSAHTLVLLESSHPEPHAYAVASSTPLPQLRDGEAVKVKVREILAVYVPRPGGPAPAIDGIPAKGAARVLSIDRSYRLLTLLRNDGTRETFKVGQNVKLREMQAGDDVAVQSRQVIAVQPGQ